MLYAYCFVSHFIFRSLCVARLLTTERHRVMKCRDQESSRRNRTLQDACAEEAPEEAETDEPCEGTHLRDHGVLRARGTGKETVCGTGLPTLIYLTFSWRGAGPRERPTGGGHGWLGRSRVTFPWPSTLDLIVHQVTRHSLLLRPWESRWTVTYAGCSLPNFDNFDFDFVLIQSQPSLQVTLGSHLQSGWSHTRGKCYVDMAMQTLTFIAMKQR